ncbi:MAG: potassium/hydrogen antiporter [Actinomycetota bacterium]|nr:potassium/hydrogen antiporter [Actinomycetota bacterium]
MNRRLPIPRPAVLFVGAAVVGQLFARLHEAHLGTVEVVVSLALVVILFDGGMQIGVRRFREAAGAIASVGVLGTFATTAALAVLAHVVMGLGWYPAVLLGTALAPTDPAVVFSVLGKRQLAGRSGTILEGESGANDPVGIALMVSLLTAGELSGSAVADVASAFVLQMLVGAVVGAVGGLVLRRLLRSTRLPARLGALPTVVAALLLYGIAAVAHGSGFLAVFVAGIVVGDGAWPHAREIRSFHSSLAGLGEVTAFVVLGLTVDLAVLGHTEVWAPGLVLGALLALVVRPLVVGLCLLPVHLPRNERAFVLLAGLKGAVPILLGTFLLAEQVDHADRLYGIVVVVVIFSVVVQGGLVPTAVRRLRLPLRNEEDGGARSM